LSDVLAIHLKRFRLNWEMMRTEKVNKRFEFPLDLDMFPYTKEGIEWKSKAKDTERIHKNHDDAYYHFTLVGVVVHSGDNLNGGHYYSYARTTKGWFEFNDAVVKPFNICNLERESFGGNLGYKQENNGYSQDLDSANTAYMLFYERKAPLVSDIEFLKEGTESKKQISKLKRMIEAPQLTRQLLHTMQAETHWLGEVYKYVEEENVALDKAAKVFDPSFADFMVNVTHFAANQFRNLLQSFDNNYVVLEQYLNECSVFIRTATVFALVTLSTSRSRSDLKKPKGSSGTPNVLIMMLDDLYFLISNSSGLGCDLVRKVSEDIDEQIEDESALMKSLVTENCVAYDAFRTRLNDLLL